MPISAVPAPESRPSSYEWRVPGVAVRVRLDLDVIDRMLADVLRGFGTASRRTVEVGGVLLGSILDSPDGKVVTVIDYEPFARSPQSGGDWRLEDDEQLLFGETVQRWRATPGSRIGAVGFYRSHNRRGFELVADDIGLWDRFLPDPGSVVLLVKPFATRPSMGAFFVREDGPVTAGPSLLEFPFRRAELGGGQVSPELGGTSSIASVGPETRGGASTMLSISESPSAAAPQPLVGDQLLFGVPAASGDQATGRKLRSGWVWIPLSFFFLLLGVVLGFYVAMNMRSQLPAALQDEVYRLNMAVGPSGESLHVRWDRGAPVLRRALRGVLSIEDGPNQKKVPLDLGQLMNGTVIYRKATGDVRFRLEVFTGDRSSFSESVEFRAGAQ